VPEDERGDELARLQKIRDEAKELEREMAEMEMEMSMQEQQLTLASRKADQTGATAKRKAPK